MNSIDELIRQVRIDLQDNSSEIYDILAELYSRGFEDAQDTVEDWYVPCKQNKET